MKVKTKKIEKSEVKITLTEREAVALAALLGCCGGWVNGKNNIREIITDNLWTALDAEGFAEGHRDYETLRDTITETPYIGK